MECINRGSSRQEFNLPSAARFSYLYDYCEDNSPEEVEKRLRYSAYKFGSSSAILEFSQELAQKFNANHSEGFNTKEWIVVTPPTGSLPSPITPVASAVSSSLGLRNIRTHAHDRPRITAEDYAQLQTQSERNLRRKEDGISFSAEEDLRGKKAVIVEDMVNTGTTLKILIDSLLSKGVSEVEVISIGLLGAGNPEFEHAVDNQLLQNIPTLLSILNEEQNIFNRHAVKTIYRLPDDDFESIINGLSPVSLTKLLENGILYFGDLDRMERIRQILH